MGDLRLEYQKELSASTMDKFSKEDVKDFSSEYIKFLNAAKTEYLCVKEVEKFLVYNGFVDINTVNNLNAGDKVYFINREKSIFAAVVGKKNLSDGINIVGAHIDSPRLDLKPMPLYEKEKMAFFKTQYYGGIKKYQWLAIPLEMHGVIYNESGEKIVISEGGEDSDNCFTITDLLPHLAYKMMKKNAEEFIDPEDMNILVGNEESLTKDEKIKDKVKFGILEILNSKYGIKEIDFSRSEIAFVPAFKSKYLGFDNSMVAGYGQDDRVCAYTAVMALVDSASQNQEKTSVAILVDKEEIGSVGNTSMSSEVFDMFVSMLALKKGEINLSLYRTYYNSNMLSADVSSAVDPIYSDVSDIQNSNILGCGVSIMKYTGKNGKSGCNDANCNYVAEVMKIFDSSNVKYQIGTLGKIERGGGGTIAYILAKKGMNVIDCGTPVLSMHSPYEVTSVYDIYNTFLAYKAFFK